MRFINTLILFLTVQVSSAVLAGEYPINPDNMGMNYGTFSAKNILLPIGASSISSDGRFIAYLTEHENLIDTSTIDYIAHRYDRTLNITLSSSRIISSVGKGTSQSIKMVFEDTSAQSILFTHPEPDSSTSSNFSGFAVSRYNFNSKDASNYITGVGLGWSVSPSGQFFIYASLGSLNVFDKEENIEIAVPISYALANGNVVNFLKPGILFTHRGINDQGDIILVADVESQILEGASRYYLYNVKTEKFNSLQHLISSNYDITIGSDNAEFSKALRLEVNVPLISNNGKYISLVAKNSSGELIALLLDTVTLNVIEHEFPSGLNTNSLFIPRLLTNTGIAQYVMFLEDVSNSTEGTVVYYLYDFNSKKVIEHASISIPSSTSSISELQWKMIDQVSLDGNFAVVYDALMKNIPDQSNQTEVDASLFWVNLSSNNESVINITPDEATIDPYINQVSQFAIDISGTDIYGLDVSCNLSSASLSVTQASYDGLFGSQNTMTLPLIYSTYAVTGTETLVAPELPFMGAGSFVLADVIAEFTTEDVEVTCAAEVSDENGQLLQVTLTPATIRIDDGVHGGAGSVSGSIEIPGVTDLSGVEIVLTIDGRQVIVITDETGHFEFDGLRDGEFTISLASDNYVQSCQVANVTEGGAVDLGSIELLAGDINADGNIDIADFTFMAARYRSNQGDADYDAKSDLNHDGTINIQDLAILGSHFGSTQCNTLQ
jgi:hypothetical protein